LLALAIGIEDGLIGVGRAIGHPGQERGANVEADSRVIVDNSSDAVVRTQNARRRVGRVTLGGDALVPVVIGVRGVLHLDDFEPGVLARWLIKMTVNTKISVHKICGADYEGDEFGGSSLIRC